jgi:integrase
MGSLWVFIKQKKGGGKRMSRYTKSKKYTGVYYEVLSNRDKSYYITYKHENKKHWVFMGKSSEGINENFAHTQRNLIINGLRFGSNLPPLLEKKINKPTALTLDDIAAVYFRDKAITNKSNKRNHSRYTKNIAENLGGKEIARIKAEDIQEYQRVSLIAKKAPYTVNWEIGLIKAIFNHAIKKGIYSGLNPAKVESIKVDNTRERYLTKNEVITLLERIAADRELKLFVLFSLSTGGRLNTILNIKRQDLDLLNDTISLKDIKNNNSYRGFINPQLKAAILEHGINKMPANDTIIKTPERTLQRRLQAILDDLFNVGVIDRKNKVVIHSLRHTFASNLAINGVSLYLIQKLLNHKDIQSTARYSKLSPENGKMEINSLWSN